MEQQLPTTPQPAAVVVQPTRLSLQRVLEQDRAKAAWDCIEAVKEKNYQKEYSGLARSATADIQANGLGQTLAFWRAKGSKDGRPKSNGDNAHWQIQTHVSTWVMKQLKVTQSDGLLQWIMQRATTDEYRWATAEAIAFLIWLKRFAEAELG